ncbi:MAG: glycogen debranching enzyme family protein [Chloroflexi bacterium]|nr:glycogen debranching enzyme family protein [Chloroflexota bacterium]
MSSRSALPAPRSPPASAPSPLVSIGREVCGDLEAGLRREWLVTNGLGGYASGALAGVNTRRYHGLLVAALTPPVGRTVLVAGADEWATYHGRRYPLCAHEFGDGVVGPEGYRHLQAFELDGMLPVWTFALGDALVERRVWMAHGANTTYVSYQLPRGSGPVDLEVTPLVTWRDFHALRRAGAAPVVGPIDLGATVEFEGEAGVLRLRSDVATFTPGGAWWWNFRYREETARGLDDHGDLYAPGTFAVTLTPGACCTLVYSAEPDPDVDGSHALVLARQRQLDLLERAGVVDADPVVCQLTLAADQFIVARSRAPRDPPEAAYAPEPADAMGQSAQALDHPPRDNASAPSPSSSSSGVTVIAGYHWFNDWGRDTMIALPGLALATNRPEAAAGILRTFGRYVKDGLCPNNFPDVDGVVPGYNTADATLWYILAVQSYERATGDRTLADELLPILLDIIARHQHGTRHGIRVDPADGLLHAGEPGVQLTWMDAKVGDWVVTPRTGKPVEINALWYNALRAVSALLEDRGEPDAVRLEDLAGRTRDAFRARFRRPGHSHLADVVDGPDGNDWTVRPNQIFAVSLPYPLIEGADAAGLVDAVGRELLAGIGLRSLSPNEPGYQGAYGGDVLQRDGAYHQGPSWTWLIGPYAEAHYKVHHNREAALSLLRPVLHHLRDAGLGTISEILEGDPPHAPRGCIAQAWSVGEVLRVWRLLAG